MRFYFIAFFIFIFYFQNFAQEDFAPEVFPSYNSVVKYFFKNYNAPEDYEKLFFEKRPEGYFVSKSFEFPFDIRKKREVLWSFETKSFQKLKQYNSGSANSKNLKWDSPYLQPYNSHEFDFCAFAGYPSWQLDVIDYFGKKEVLTDTLLYGLARAYTTHATNLISHRDANFDKEKQFNLRKGKNSLTTEQLKIYREYFHSGHKAFLKLSQQNPDFETIVGKIYIKYCNEVMNTFLQLLYFQNEKEARKELLPNLYDDFYINVAKNYLNSCPPNSILFTYGDNDTYPLLYVQAQMNFRTDVMVVNTSLLNLDRYIDYLRKGVFDASGYPLPFESSYYEGDKNSITYTNLIEKKENSSLHEAIKYIKDEKNRYGEENKKVASFPSNNLFIKIDKNKIINQKIVPPSQHENIVDTIKWEISQNYIFKNDLILLGLIAQNNWQRPICIGSTCRKSNFIGMNDYFHLEGLIYRLYPIKRINVVPYLHGGVNVEESYNKLIKNFSYDGIDKIESGRRIYYSSYFVLFHETAKGLIANGEKKKATNVLDKFFEIFPNRVKEFDGQLTWFTKQYFELGENKKAETCALQIIKNLLAKEKLSNRDTYAFQTLSKQGKEFGSEILINELKQIGW